MKKLLVIFAVILLGLLYYLIKLHKDTVIPFLSFDSSTDTLKIVNGSSFYYFAKLDTIVQNDTLIISVFGGIPFLVSSTKYNTVEKAHIKKIQLAKNIKYVKFGSKLINLDSLGGAQKTLQLKTDSIDLKSKLDRQKSNNKFKINDSGAIKLVRQVKELKELIDLKYKKDTTVFNLINIYGIPNDTNPNWVLNIRQEQPRIEQSYSLMFLSVNAYNGKILIWDFENEKDLTIDEWRKKIKK